MKDKGIKIKETIMSHIINNKKEYIIVLVLFIIGIFLGVLFSNNMEEIRKEDVETFLNNFINKMKANENLNAGGLLHTSIWNNILIAVMIWFFGTTVIRNSNSIWYNYI